MKQRCAHARAPERYPSAIELVLDGYAPLIAIRGASPLALEAAVAAMAPATRAAITADLKCFLHWCGTRWPAVAAVPAEPATLARRLASIARIHRILGLGETTPLPTQAGMVRDTLKALRRDKRQRQRQAAPLRYGAAMAEGQAPPDGVTVQALLASCGDDLVGLRDAALISVAYDGGLRVSELVGTGVADLNQVADGSGRLAIAHSKTDQEGEGALAWLSPETMGRLSAWLTDSGIDDGPVFRRINLLRTRGAGEGQQLVEHFIGPNALTRQGCGGDPPPPGAGGDRRRPCRDRVGAGRGHCPLA